MTAVDRFSSDSFRRLLDSVNSVSFRDEKGEVEYFEEKVVILTRESFQIFREELAKRNASGTGSLIMGLVGRSVGRAQGKTIASNLRQTTGAKSPAREDIRIVVEETNLGYGKASVEKIDNVAKTATISLTNSFEVSSQLGPQGSTCFFMLGYFEGLLSQLVGTELRGIETTCASRGDSACTFSLSPEPKSNYRF